MRKDVDELQHITSPDRAVNLEHAIRLRLSVLNQQLSDAEGMPNDRVSDDVESLKQAIMSSGLNLEQKETALANLEKIQRDCTEITGASAERKLELKEALKLRLAALNHQLGSSSMDLVDLQPLTQLQVEPVQTEEHDPTADELAATVLSAILPNLGDYVQEIDIEIPITDDNNSGDDVVDESCERALRQIPPLLAGGLRCPVHHRPYPQPIFPDDLVSPNSMRVQSAVSPVHLQTLAQLEPLHEQVVDQAMDMSNQPMVLKIEEKDGFNVISGWFPGITKDNLEIKLDGDTLRLNAVVTDKSDVGLDEAHMFNIDLHDAKSIEEELDLPYAPPAQLFKAHFNDEKHTFVAVFPKQETVDVKLE